MLWLVLGIALFNAGLTMLLVLQSRNVLQRQLEIDTERQMAYLFTISGEFASLRKRLEVLENATR